VPLLNLSAGLLDRLAPALRSLGDGAVAPAPRIDPSASGVPRRTRDPAKAGLTLAPRRRHLAYISMWAVAFGAMSASGYLGDKHPGQWLPFCQKACAADARFAKKLKSDRRIPSIDATGAERRQDLLHKVLLPA
jgi:hypothetical protein